MQPGFLSFYGAVLNVAQDRQNLIANNIANADTPGFKAADVDFTVSLAQQLESPGCRPSKAGCAYAAARRGRGAFRFSRAWSRS